MDNRRRGDVAMGHERFKREEKIQRVRISISGAGIAHFIAVALAVDVQMWARYLDPGYDAAGRRDQTESG